MGRKKKNSGRRNNTHEKILEDLLLHYSTNACGGQIRTRQSRCQTPHRCKSAALTVEGPGAQRSQRGQGDYCRQRQPGHVVGRRGWRKAKADKECCLLVTKFKYVDLPEHRYPKFYQSCNSLPGTDREAWLDCTEMVIVQRRWSGGQKHGSGNGGTHLQIPALGRIRRADLCEFKAILTYLESFRPARATQ